MSAGRQHRDLDYDGVPSAAGKGPLAWERRTPMKTLVVAGIGLAVMALANPAAGDGVEAATSIPVATIPDHSRFKAALESAVDDVLTHAIAIPPTVVAF